MFDYLMYPPYLPGEPTPEAKFREELANDRAPSEPEDEPTIAPDTDQLMARQVLRTAGFVRFA
jgi:hypothetical protein